MSDHDSDFPPLGESALVHRTSHARDTTPRTPPKGQRNPSPRVALVSRSQAEKSSGSPRSDSNSDSTRLLSSACSRQANGALAQVLSPSVANAHPAKDAVYSSKQQNSVSSMVPNLRAGAIPPGNATFEISSQLNSEVPEDSILSLNQLVYVRVKLASQSESAVRFLDSLDFQKSFFEQVTALTCLKDKEFLSSLHCALTKHSGPSIKHIKGCYFTAGFAFQNPSIKVNVPKLILDQQLEEKSQFFSFKLPATSYRRDRKPESTIMPAKVQFALEKDFLLESFRLEFVIKIPFIAPPNPIQEAASLICQVLFLEEYRHNSSSAELLQEQRRIQSFCSYDDKVQLLSKASISGRTITGFFPLSLDDADSRDVPIAQRLVFGALFGIDPRVKQYERFSFSLPILSDLDQLRKRPAFKSIVEGIRSNEAFADLIVIRPRRVRKHVDSDSTLESSTSASDSDIASSIQAVKRLEAIQMLPRIPLLHTPDFESEEFPALHQSESFKSQPVELIFPQITEVSEHLHGADPKPSSTNRIVVFDDIPCKFFAKGKCKLGDNCTFSHSAAKSHENGVAASKIGDCIVQQNIIPNETKNKPLLASADQKKPAATTGRSGEATSAQVAAAVADQALSPAPSAQEIDVAANKNGAHTLEKSMIAEETNVPSVQIESSNAYVAQFSDEANLASSMATRVFVASPPSALLPRNLEHEWHSSTEDVFPFECRILSAIAQSTSSPNFCLDKDTLHSPRHLSKINIGSFHFMQSDYGICFEKFWNTLHLEDELKTSSAALENYRCFYIHLGIGTGMHPFAIHYAFRNRASHLLQSSSKMLQSSSFLAVSYIDSLKDTLSSSSFVDSNILLTCWPLEWSHFRIIIWNGPALTWFVYEPFPDEDNQEIILAFEGAGGGAHYTLLSYWSLSLFHSLKLFLLKHDQSHDSTLLSPRKKYGFTLQVVAPESFAIVNKGISPEDSTQWPELNETFSVHKSLSAFHHHFQLRTIPDIPSDLIENPSVWPPLNSAERFAASLFPEPCKQSGRFHTCCGSAGNCRCGLSGSLDNIHGCGDSLCHWKSTEDPYHFSHDLTVHAFSDVLQKIQMALPRWIEHFNQAEKDNAILAYVITERLMTIYCTLQHRYVSLDDEESLFYMKSSLLSIRLIAREAIKLLESSQTVFPTPPLALLHYMIETIDMNAGFAAEQALDSIGSTQSGDVPIISSNPRYTLERDEECSRALNFVKHIYSLATRRLHSITQEGKLVAIEQLQGLHKQVARIVDASNNLGHGLSSLSAKRSVCTRSVEEIFETATIIATELSSLISKISITAFPKAPPPPKPGSHLCRKTQAVEIIDPMLLESLCRNIVDLLGTQPSFSKQSHSKSQQSKSHSSLKSSNPFAPLANLIGENEVDLEADAISGDEDVVASAKDSSSDELDSNLQEQSSDCSSEDHEKEEGLTNERRALFGSTASPFLAEARNIHSKGNQDSFDSAAGDSVHSSDRDFVDDASQKAKGTPHHALFNAQSLRDAGLLSPTSIAVKGINIIYCPRGHAVNLPYKTPKDNERRKLSQILCSTCLAVVKPSQQAYNCPCASHIVCQLCVQASSSFPKPPDCKKCGQSLVHSPCTRKTCATCDFVCNIRTELWICENKSCRAAFCKGCIPPPDASFKPGRVPPATSSSSSLPPPSSSASNSVSGKPAPMLATGRA